MIIDCIEDCKINFGYFACKMDKRIIKYIPLVIQFCNVELLGV